MCAGLTQSDRHIRCLWLRQEGAQLVKQHLRHVAHACKDMTLSGSALSCSSTYFSPGCLRTGLLRGSEQGAIQA